MKIIGKPANRWGWLRIAGLIALAAVIVWTLRSVVLRGLGVWGWYLSFSLLDGVQLAVIPLLAVLLGGWLEEQDLKSDAEKLRHHEAEQAVAAQRRETLKRFHAAAQTAGEDRPQLSALIRTALPELDGQGRGELLHFIHEKGWGSAEAPALDLSGADLSGLVLHHPHLNALRLENVNLAKAKLNGAHLAHSRLAGADLTGAFLRHADLREADLTGCHLSGASLQNANLEGADLTGADLTGTLLANARLKHCKLGGLSALDEAVLVETILPDGQKLTNEKGKLYLREKELSTLVDKL